MFDKNKKTEIEPSEKWPETLPDSLPADNLDDLVRLVRAKIDDPQERMRQIFQFITPEQHNVEYKGLVVIGEQKIYCKLELVDPSSIRIRNLTNGIDTWIDLNDDGSVEVKELFSDPESPETINYRHQEDEESFAKQADWVLSVMEQIGLPQNRL